MSCKVNGEKKDASCMLQVARINSKHKAIKNTKFEYRNSKQFLNSKFQICFVLRASDFVLIILSQLPQRFIITLQLKSES